MFVVSVSSIPDDINKNIFLVSLTIFNRKFQHFVNKFRFISIDMDDRSLDGLGNTCTVKSSSGLSWSGCESYLVICHNMDDSIDAIVLRISQLKALEHDSLTCYSCISMNNHS